MKKTIQKNKNSSTYEKEHPQKAEIIKKAVRRGLKEYAETFRKLATT